MCRMSDASDEIQVDAPAEVEAPTEAPKGKLSVEEALQVRKMFFVAPWGISFMLQSRKYSKY